MSDPNDFITGIGHCSIFRLTTGARDSWLFLGTPGYKIAPEEYRVTISGTTGLEATSPISIRVAYKSGICRFGKGEYERNHTLDIS